MLWSTEVFASGDRQVLAADDRGSTHRPLYSGTGGLRLSWGLRKLANAAALSCALASAACSYQLDSMFSKDDVETTGSIARPGAKTAAAEAARPSELDLAYASAAAADVLAHGGKDNSVPWQNPQTGASGNITPLATSYNEGGLPCRDFLASYVHAGSQDWLQGAACRSVAGKWEVKRIKPLSRS